MDKVSWLEGDVFKVDRHVPPFSAFSSAFLQIGQREDKILEKANAVISCIGAIGLDHAYLT